MPSALVAAVRSTIDVVNGRQSMLIIVIHGLIVLGALTCATVLTALHDLPIDFAEGIFGAAITFGGAISGGVVLRQVPKSNPSVPTSVLQAAIEAAQRPGANPAPPSV